MPSQTSHTAQQRDIAETPRASNSSNTTTPVKASANMKSQSDPRPTKRPTRGNSEFSPSYRSVTNLTNVQSTGSGDSTSAADKDCLDVSMNILNASLKKAKAGYDSTVESSSWWTTIFHKMENQHASERQKWKEDLRVAKLRGKNLKSELRDNIEHRIQWLEDKLTNQEQPTGCLSRASSGTSFRDGDASTIATGAEAADNWGNLYPDDSLYQALAGVEVPYDSAQALRRLTELEKTVEQYEFEKEEWSKTLEQASRGIQQGEKLSIAMQRQLSQLTKEVDSHNDKNHYKCKEKMKVQKQLLELLEQQLSTERYEWKHEKETLDGTIQQLAADKAELKDELKAKRKDEKKFMKLQQKWDDDRQIMQNSIVQLTNEKLNYKREADNLKHSLRSKDNMRTDLDAAFSTDGSNSSVVWKRGEGPLSPHLRIEWDEKLDRAMAERDLYKQESEHARYMLEQEREKWANREEELKRSAQAVEQQFRQDLEESTRSRCTDKVALQPLSPSNDEGVRMLLSAKEEEWKGKTETLLKGVRDEYTAVIENLENQLNKEERSAADRLKESFTKHKDLAGKLRSIEQERSDDKGNWKLQLETALADARKCREIKEALEAEIRELKDSAKDSAVQPSAESSFEKNGENIALIRNLDASREDVALLKRENENLVAQLYCLKEEYEREGKEVIRRASELPTPVNRDEWKLQTEAVLAETRRMRAVKEAVEAEMRDLIRKHEEEANVWAHQAAQNVIPLNTLKAEVNSTQSELACLKGQNEALALELESCQVKLKHHERESKRQADLYEDLKEKYERETFDWSAQLDEAKLSEQVNVEDLQRKRDQLKKKLSSQLEKQRRTETKTITELKEQHIKEKRDLKEQLVASENERRALADQTNSLSDKLDELKEQHTKANRKLESQLQVVIAEKDGRIHQLEIDRNMDDSNRDVEKKRIDSLQSTFSTAVEELRKDVVAVRETLENATLTDSTIATVDQSVLKEAIEQMQASLNDVLSEITLETDSIIEVKKLLEKLSISAGDSVSPSKIMEQQERLLTEVGSLREDFKTLAPKDESQPTATFGDLRQDILSRLQQQEQELANLRTDLAAAKSELIARTELLQRAELEVTTLNDQADASCEELIRLQALNTGLEETLRIAEQKMEAVLHEPYMSKRLDQIDEYGDSGFGNDSTPLLEEALALAHGLQDLVNGRGKDQNVLEMLQSFSDLMDRDDGADGLTASPTFGMISPVASDVSEGEAEKEARNEKNTEMRTSVSTPLRSRASFLKYPSTSGAQREEPPPDPVTSPRNDSGDPDTASLQIIVEQLFGRCQLLERERTQMMEVTLNLLESARDANEAELKAAIATARRKSMEDIQRVQKQSHHDQQRLYQKLRGSSKPPSSYGIPTRPTVATSMAHVE
jgi:hypothetical protein